MSLVDSGAAFEKRCNELAPWLSEALAGNGITTFSSLAFALGTPQAAPSDDDTQRFSDRVMGGPASLAEVSVIKRIHYEASTLIMVDIKRQSSAQDLSEPSKTLPYVEKQRRLQAPGLTHRNEQAPSHALIDLCFSIVESGSLKYVPPSKCGSRDAEIVNDAKNGQKQLVTIEQGALKTLSGESMDNVDVGTEMKLMYALQRRGLAFDLVGLMSWETHLLWTTKLFRALMVEVPTGFAPPTLQQLIRCDQEVQPVGNRGDGQPET